MPLRVEFDLHYNIYLVKIKSFFFFFGWTFETNSIIKLKIEFNLRLYIQWAIFLPIKPSKVFEHLAWFSLLLQIGWIERP